ncbi:MAG: MFS transporter [Pseudomonadota bacterium]
MSTVAPARPQGAARRRYGVLLLLTVVYAFNFIDRQILGILAPYIQADLKLDDGQLGLLAGFYFALFYTVVGLPIAWLADRYNRVTIVAVSLAVWSGFTAASGLAGSYVQLALARMGVGIGEAGGSPPSHSMISDLFASHERARALSLYSLGIPIGIMVAYFASAALLGQTELNWRAVFIAVGLPGVLLAVVLKLLVAEPARGAMEQKPAKPMGFGAAMTALLRIPSYWTMCLGISFASFVAYALSTFTVVFLRRRFPDFPVFDLLVFLGIAHGVAYASGTYLGGVVADRWGQATRAGYALTPVLSLSVGLPCMLAFLWTDSVAATLVALTLYLVTIGFHLGPSFSIAQSLAPVSIRATSTAIFFFVLNLIGLGAGPSYAGFVSDALTENHGELEALRLALTSLGAVTLIAIGCFALAARSLPRDWEVATRGGAG